MTESFRALCSDFYINSKISAKLELPGSRETVLELFERIRHEFPTMSGFKRYRDELALESPTSDLPHRWIAVRQNTVRAGVVNPQNAVAAYSLHKRLAETVPYFLSVSPLDVESVELLFGFDLSAGGNHDAIVAEALLGGSPIARFAELGAGGVHDCQPLLGFTHPEDASIDVLVEVKTRGAEHHAPDASEPISLYLTVRRTCRSGPLEDMPAHIEALAEAGESLVTERLVPHLLTPLREAITNERS